MIQCIKQNKRLFLIWLVSLVCIATSIMTTTYLSVVALLLFFYSVVFCDINDSMSLLLGLIPFANIFKLSPESTSLFTICEIFIVAALVLKKKMRSTFVISVLLLVIYIIVFSLESFHLLTIIKVVCGFFLIYFAATIYTREDLKITTYLLSASTALMLLLTTNQIYLPRVETYFSDLNYLIDETGHASETMRMSGFFGDPNYCALFLMIVLSLLCVLYYYKNIGNEFWVFTVIIIVCGLFTYSKSFFLAIALYAVFLTFFVLFPKYQGWAIVAVFAIGVVALLSLSGKIPVIETILMRFEDGDLTTGRNDLNEDYLKYIVRDMKVLFFGEGITIERYEGSANNVHNLYIELFYKMGVIGTVMYIGVVFAALKNRATASVRVKRPVVNYVPLFFFFLMFLFLAGILNYVLPFYIIIVYLCFNYNKLGGRTSDD